jgi:hypothetical protein
MPLAASITTFSGAIAAGSTNDRHRSTYCGQMSWSSTVPPGPVLGLTPDMARSRMSSRPESPPTGSAPARTIFIPVYSFGLCEAVTAIPPSRPSSPTAK